jgi:hypothetical protein
MKALGAILTTFFAINFVTAQEAIFGLKAGANYSTIYGGQIRGYQPRLGFQAGGFVIFEINENLYFQPELLYSNQGFIIDTDLQNFESEFSGDPNIKVNTQKNYLTFPLIVDFKLNNSLSLEVGPQFAFLIDQISNTKERDLVDAGVERQRFKTNGDFALEYGLAAGISYKLTNNLFMQPRVYLGIANNIRGEISEVLHDRSLSFQLFAGYTF